MTPLALRPLRRWKSVSMPLGDRTAVGSSRISSFASATSARAISTPCCELDRQVANAIREPRLNAEIFEMPLPARLETAPREDRAAPPCAELHRLGDGEGGRQREALVDKFHTRRARSIDVAVARLRGRRSRASPEIGLDDSGDDAREGRLAGAVLPDDGMDELWRKGDAHASQRGDVAIAD